jgi:acetoin utilization deacetylase AcuC-like enzyme
MNRTAVVADRHYMDHHPGRVHPERPERISALLEMAGRIERSHVKLLTPRDATKEELELCHSADYIAEVEQTAAMERFDFDPDTHTSRGTWRTADLAVGGVLTAVEAVIDGEVDNAFAIVRPPGHHARPNQAMGFCFFNNVAIAARWLTEQRRLERILILDWDVHHGNGTQEMFYTSPNVLYMSSHQYPFYPGTGWFNEIGAAEGLGYTVNAPLAAGFGDPEYLRLFDEVFLPIARQLKPQFVLISAGFDCHFRDPLGGMRVTEEGFIGMARRLKRVAAETCDGKVVAVLEGGYDLTGLSGGVHAVIDEFGRDSDEHIASPSHCDRIAPIIDRARHFLSQHWDF